MFSKLRLTVSIVVIGAINFAFGQTVQDHEDYFKKALYKTETPGAWTFSDFSTEGNVDISTGKFGLTIPFTTIENDFLSLPVKLVYSTGGVKLGENASEVGMGWNLVAGGAVRRILNGVPDEIKSEYAEGEDTGKRGAYNLYTGKAVPGFADAGYSLHNMNSLVTKWFRGSATTGYQDYYSNHYPTPIAAGYWNVAAGDYLACSIMQMQSTDGNVENKRDVFHVSAGDLNFNFIIKLKDSYIPYSDTGGTTISLQNFTDAFEAVPLDDKDIRIEMLYGKIDNYWYVWTSATQRSKLDYQYGLTGFIITDKNGVKYYFQNYAFTEPEYIQTLLDQSSGVQNYQRTIQYVLQDVQINDWELSRIALPNGKQIYFDYSKKRIVEKRLIPRQHDGEYTGHPYNLRPQKPSYAIETVDFAHEKYYLEKIRTDDLTVQFNYVDGRLDLQNAQKLSSIQLFDFNDVLIKQFELVQQYNGASTSDNYESKRLFLTIVIEKGILNRMYPVIFNTPSYEGKYVFDYYNPDSLPGKNAIGFEDLYGYYLGNTVANAYPPFPKLYLHANLEGGHKISYYPMDTDTFTFNGAERRPNSGTVYYGALKTVSFPTKGSLEITYEPNKFYDSYLIDTNANGPGCRVRQLNYYTGAGTVAKIKKYGYTNFANAALSSGMLMYKPSYAYISNYAIDNSQDLAVEQTQQYPATQLGYNVFLKYTKSAETLLADGNSMEAVVKKLVTTSTHSLGPQSDFFGREIVYTNVLEEDVSIADNSSKGKTKYFNHYWDNRPEVNVVSGPTNDFTYIPPASRYAAKNNSPNTVPWCCDAPGGTGSGNGHVMVGYGFVEKRGKEIYPFPARNYFGSNEALKIGKTYKVEYLDGNNNLLKKKDYTFGRIDNVPYKTLNFSTGYLSAYYYSSAQSPNLRLEVFSLMGKPLLQDLAGLYFYSIDSLYTRQKMVLLKEETTDYAANGAVIAKTEYEYNNRFLASNAKKTNSDGTLFEDKYYYPFNLSEDDPQPLVDVLQQDNRISEVVKHETYANGTMMGSTLKIYKQEGFIVPDKIYEKKGLGNTGTFDSEIYASFDKHDDKGNILQYRLRNGTPVSVIWGYRKKYPIAKIENCTYASIPAATISNLQVISDNDIDNCFTGNCNEQALRNALNALRSSFPSAMITTYTYDPLIGLTSTTDPKGDRTTYVYDDFGRLKEVRDKDGNIVSENQYHYRPN